MKYDHPHAVQQSPSSTILYNQLYTYAAVAYRLDSACELQPPAHSTAQTRLF